MIFDLADVVAFDTFSSMSLGAEACGIEVRYGTVGNLEGPLFWTIYMQISSLSRATMAWTSGESWEYSISTMSVVMPASMLRDRYTLL